MLLTPDQNHWLESFKELSNLELRLLSEKQEGAFEPSAKSLFAKSVLEDRISSARDAREAKTLDIAKSANLIASEALKVARSSSESAAASSLAEKNKSAAHTGRYALRKIHVKT